MHPETKLLVRPQGHNMNPWQSLKLMSLPAALMLVLMTMMVEYKDLAANNAGAAAP